MKKINKIKYLQSKYASDAIGALGKVKLLHEVQRIEKVLQTVESKLILHRITELLSLPNFEENLKQSDHLETKPSIHFVPNLNFESLSLTEGLPEETESAKHFF